MHVPRLSAEWGATASHVAAIFIATARDPLGALTYAVTAGVTGPIVLLVPRRLLADARDVLAAGALACVPLPVHTADRDALARALGRRARLTKVDGTLRLLLDPIAHTVRYRTRAIRLSQREFAVLYCLSAQDGRPIPADELLRRVWQNVPPEARHRLDFYIHQLRRKLDTLGLPGAIATVRGYGYVLAPVNADSRARSARSRLSAAAARGRPR